MLSILLAFLILGVGEPGPVTVELLPSKLEAFASMPKAEIKVESDGKTVTYSGVPLSSILDARDKPTPGMAGLRNLSDAVILVRGADGYQAAVSAAAVAMDPKGERYLLATSRDGQSRPGRLIIPADPKHARWVRDVVAIRLVRLDQVVKPGP